MGPGRSLRVNPGGVSCQNDIKRRPVDSHVMTAWVLLLFLLPLPALAAAPLKVGRVTIISGDIFSPAEIDSSRGVLGFIQRAMNNLSIDTRQYVLRKELLFHEGDDFDPDLLAETERNLRELGFLNQVAVAAVDTTDGLVDVEVRTSESWTLQSSFAFSRGGNGDTRWSVSLSEKNFLGHGLTLGAGTGADENANFWNFWFRKRRLTAHHLLVGADYSDRNDGHYRNVFVSRPFYAQTDPWTAQISAWDAQSSSRYYLSHARVTGTDPAQQESLYAKIPTRRKGVQVLFQKRVTAPDASRIWRVGAGLRITEQDVRVGDQQLYVLSDERLIDLDPLLGPGQPLARDQGTTVYPFLWIRSLGREWAKSRFVLQYGPTEDIPLNWSFNLFVGPNGPQMGSTSGFGGATWLTEVGVSRWWMVGGGFGTMGASGVWQSGSQENRFHTAGLSAGWVRQRGNENHPWITRVFAEYAQGGNLAPNQALLLGLERGLRTLDFDGRAGDRLARWSIEQGKAMPGEVLGMFRLGAAVFYSGGNAWWRDEDRNLGDARHEVGCGLRLGPTRSGSAQTSRFDMSWALDGSSGPVFTASTRGLF